MSALDTFGALPATPAKHYAAKADQAAGQAAGHGSSGDEFSRMMEQALAPATPKNQPKQPAAPVTSHTGSAMAHAAAGRSKTPAAKAADDFAAGARDCADQPAETQATQPVSTPATDVADTADQPGTVPAEADKTAEAAASVSVPLEPLPVLMSLPFAAYFRAAAGLGDSAAGQNNLTAPMGGPVGLAAAVTTATPTAATETMASAVVSGAGTPAAKSESAPAGPGATGEKISDEKAAWLKSLAPSSSSSSGARTESKSTQPAVPVPSALADQAVAPAAEGSERVAVATLAEAAPAAGNLPAGKETRTTTGKTDAMENAGTGVAFNDSAMKKNENTIKLAGLDVKVLPGSVTELAQEKNLPTHLVVAPVNAPENRPNDLNGVPLPAGAPTVETPSSMNMVELPTLGDARMRSLERTHDMVSLHAMRLVESKSDTLQVTIKPSVGTELSLELRHRNGTIEAQATVERGDFQFLNQHWPELQQKLEQRGIRLAPLGGEANLLGGDSSEARRQAAQEEAAVQASAFAEFASVGNFGGASARLAVDYDGWESWA